MRYKTTMTTPLAVVQINTPEDFIDLGRGDPQLSLLPTALLQRAAAGRLAQADNAFLQYGASQGDGYFRKELAEFLTKAYCCPVQMQDLFVSAGASSALALLCTLFTRPGDAILVEEPTYFLALRVFADHGLRVVSVPTDADGIQLEALEAELQRSSPRLLYVIPAFQNPTGQTLSELRRAGLVELTRQYGCLLVADEVYQLLPHGAQPPTPLSAFCTHEHVVSLGSFSKLLAPGLRLGWVIGHHTVIKRLIACGLLQSGGGMNPFTSAVVRSLLEAGDLEPHIAKLRQVYSARAAVMAAALKRYLPAARFRAPSGGYFFWIHLPGKDTNQLRSTAQASRVDYRPGAMFSSSAGMNDYLRLSVSGYDESDIEEGVRRLAIALG